jgi:hypothetical protein
MAPVSPVANSSGGRDAAASRRLSWQWPGRASGRRRRIHRAYVPVQLPVTNRCRRMTEQPALNT